MKVEMAMSVSNYWIAPVTMDQTAYTSEVQPCAGGAEKSVDREKLTGQW